MTQILKKHFRIALLVFVLVFAGYLANLPLDYSKSIETGTYRRLLTSYDVTAATFLPYEIIEKGTLYFSKETVEGMQRVQGDNIHSLTQRNGKTFSSYPILAGIFALPIYMIPLLLNKIPALHYVEDLTKLLTLGRIAASFYTAMSVAIFYLILQEVNRLKGYKESRWLYVFMGFYAFGTNIYSIASRVLWQHTTSLLLITLIIFLLLKSLESPKYVKWLGALAALLYIARPLNIIFVTILSVYVLLHYKKEFAKYILFALPFALLLFAYNTSALGSPFTSEYVAKGDTSFSTPIIEGVVGHLFSPSRSFLFISPPLVIGLIATISSILKKRKAPLDHIFSMLSITFLAVFLVYSKWWCWYGADRFGYGFFTEWVPIVALLTYVYTVQQKRAVKIALAILMLWSVFMQFNAVFYRKSRCSGPEHNWTFYCLKPLVFTKQNY